MHVEVCICPFPHIQMSLQFAIFVWCLDSSSFYSILSCPGLMSLTMNIMYYNIQFRLQSKCKECIGMCTGTRFQD